MKKKKTTKTVLKWIVLFQDFGDKWIVDHVIGLTSKANASWQARREYEASGLEHIVRSVEVPK